MKRSLIAVLLVAMCLVPATAKTGMLTASYTVQSFEPITFHYLGLDYISLSSDTFGVYTRFNINSAFALSTDKSFVLVWQQNDNSSGSRAVNPGLSFVLGAGANVDLGFMKIILGGGPVVDVKLARLVPANDIELSAGTPADSSNLYILPVPLSVGLSGGANVVLPMSSNQALTIGAYATWLPYGWVVGPQLFGGTSSEVITFQDWNSVEVAFNVGFAW